MTDKPVASAEALEIVCSANYDMREKPEPHTLAAAQRIDALVASREAAARREAFVEGAMWENENIEGDDSGLPLCGAAAEIESERRYPDPGAR